MSKHIDLIAVAALLSSAFTFAAHVHQMFAGQCGSFAHFHHAAHPPLSCRLPRVPAVSALSRIGRACVLSSATLMNSLA